MLLGLVLLSASGCIRRLPRLLAGSEIPPDKILMLGRLAMDPPVDVFIGPNTADVGDFLNKVNLLFTDKPKRTFNDVSNADFYAATPPGSAFAVLVDRKSLFLRGVHMVSTFHVGVQGPGRRVNSEINSVLCVTDLVVEPQQGDRAIYVGLIVCHHDLETPTAQVYDEWRDIEPTFRTRVDTSVVKMRFPHPRQ